MQGSGFFSETAIAVSLCKQELTRCPLSRMGGQRRRGGDGGMMGSGRAGETRYLGEAVLQCKMDALHIPSKLKKTAA